MTQVAQRDIQNRKVEVNRIKLIEILESNKNKHIGEYEEAKKGYRALLLNQIAESFNNAKKSLERREGELKRWAELLSDEELAKTNDIILIVQSINLEMKVPRSYAPEYDAAIDIAKWDVRETLELTYAEFTCFVRDQWDWKSDFIFTNSMYTR